MGMYRFSETLTEDEKAEIALTQGFRMFLELFEGMPEELQEKPSNSPEVVAWLREHGRYPLPALDEALRTRGRSCDAPHR